MKPPKGLIGRFVGNDDKELDAGWVRTAINFRSRTPR
jgi:hypothetical protein